MRKIIFFNLLLFIILIVFQQMNVSFYNYIYFISWQSLFSRGDYLLIAFVLLLLLLFLAYLLLKVNRSINTNNHRKIVDFELSGLLLVSIIISIYRVYYVFFPEKSLIITLDYNKSYIGFVVVYIVETILLTCILIKHLKFKSNIKKYQIHYYWIIPFLYFIFGVIIMEIERLLMSLSEVSIEYRVLLNQINLYLFVVIGLLLLTILIRKILQLKESKQRMILMIVYLSITIIFITVYWVTIIQWK
jgi:hypothetical protein